MRYSTNRATPEEAWEGFIEAERSLLEERRAGSLARTLSDEPLPGESPEELRWLGIEDQYLAEEGLVELRSGGRAWIKHVEDLVPEDRSGRIEAESARAAWLVERLRREAEASDRDGRG